MDKVKKGWDRVYTREEIAAANAKLDQKKTGKQLNPEHGKKRNTIKDTITNLYIHWKSDPDLYSILFWKAVTDFAVMKLRNREFEFADMGSSNTSEDYAQEIVIKVMTALEPGAANGFKGDEKNFYAWLHRICYTQSIEFFRELKMQKSGGKALKGKHQRVEDWERTQGKAESMFSTFEDTEGELEGGENPEVHEEEAGSPYGMPTDVFRWVMLKNSSDDLVDPRTRTILRLLIQWKSYQAVADALGMSVNAVQKKLYRFSNKMEKIRNKEGGDVDVEPNEVDGQD